jgi:hypothetical protein
MIDWICGAILVTGCLATLLLHLHMARLVRQSQASLEAIMQGQEHSAAMTAEGLRRTRS